MLRQISSCKPACSWSTNLGGVQGVPAVCDINNKQLNSITGLNVKSGCDTGGQGYLCDKYIPTPVADDMSYGFAAMGAGSCCKCYQLQWTSGNAQGKRMIVQAIDLTTGSSNVGSGDVVILTPGGGVGPYDSGCRSQYGTSWGGQNGGVNNGQSCQGLPQNLQGGCYWRFNWARGDVNGWGVTYQQVTCPSKLTSISGCSA
ncbi:barwin-like endoglucanase [Thozetella sp. PMI_491]|nr:barwin-like endoglucanase [Thozetella sp. PMI_491]